MTAIDPAGLPVPRRYGAILALSLGTGMVVVDNAIATVALPTIARSLDISASSSVVIVTVYQIVMLMALLPFSALGDLLGHKRLYMGGQAVFLAASLASALAVNLPMLLAARCVQALGVAAVLSVNSALIRSTYPASVLGRGLGFNGLIIAVTSAAAPSLGGLILGAASWRWIFFAAAPVALLSLLLGRWLPSPRPHATSFDMAASALCAAMFGLLMSGASRLLHGIDSLGFGLLGLGVIVAVIFVRRESRSPRPVLPVDLLVRPLFALPVASSLFAFSASMCFIVTLPFHLQARGMTPETIGLVLAVWPIAMMVAAPFGGWASDHAPRGLPGAAGMALAALGLGSAGLVSADAPLWILAGPMALAGAGFGLFISPNSHMIVGAAPHDRAASAGALVSATRFVGQTLGAAMAAALLAAALGETPIPAFIASGLAVTAAILCLANVTRSARTARIKLETPQPPDMI